MTPLILATLLFAAGCAAGLGASARPPLVVCCSASAALLALLLFLRRVPAEGARSGSGFRARAVPRPSAQTAVRLLFLTAGVAAGGGTAREALADCRARLEDGGSLKARGVLESAPTADGAGWMRLREVVVNGRAMRCRGVVRIRVAARARAAAEPNVDAVRRGAVEEARLRAGHPVEATGRWWAFPSHGRWPVRPERRGTFSVVALKPTHGALHVLLALRGAAQERLRMLFPERSGLAEALLLAQRDGIDDAVRERFTASGLTHLLAISGTHVALVAGALLLAGGVLRLPALWSAGLAAAGTVAYVLFLGAPSPAARAALQILVLLVARLLQRPSEPFTLLAFAALVLVALDPLVLLDAGFQLSFAGIFGLLALRARLLDSLPAALPRWLRDGLAAGTAATLATTPIAALHFGTAAPIGVLASLVAIPLVALAVPAIALALLGALAAPSAGIFLAGGADLLLRVLDGVAAAAARVPGGHLYVSSGALLAGLLAVAAFLLAIGTLRAPSLARRRDRLRRPARLATALAAACAVFVLWPRGGWRGGLEIHAIDVGQGDAIALRSPHGHWIVVDAGPNMNGYDAGRARVVPFLLRQGVRRIEAIVLTHPHADHIGGTQALLEAFDVGAILDPAVPSGHELYAETLVAAGRGGVRWYAARAGREMRFGDLTLSFLSPAEGSLDASTDPNDLSVVFRAAYGRFGALFLGDAPAFVENELVARHGGELEAELLKVGHHGSDTSTRDSLLTAARPRLALVSVGRRNRYGHPHREVIARLARHGVRVLRTDERGTITVRARPDGETRITATR